MFHDKVQAHDDHEPDAQTQKYAHGGVEVARQQAGQKAR